MLYRTLSNLQGRNCPTGILRLAAKRMGFVAISMVVAALAVSLTGCDTAVSKRTEPDPPAGMDEPPPTLLGTWERTQVYTHDDGTVETEKQTVIFTDAHFIQVDARFNATGVEIDSGGGAGTVSIAASSVTVTRSGETASVEKEYLLVGEVLFIHHWNSDDLEANFDRFERVGAPPTPDESPLPLQGTWQTTGYWEDDEYGPIIESIALTFTASRAIRASTIYDSSGQQVDVWTEQAGWSTSGTTITKLILNDDDGTVQSVDKEYILAGDVLAIQDWGSDEPTSGFQVWVHSDDPLPRGISGLWAQDYEDSDEAWRVEMKVGSNGSFRRVFTRQRGDDQTREFDVTGTYELDADENFVLVTIASTLRNGEPLTSPFWSTGEVLRFAYAPTTNPDLIVMSMPWWEQSYDIDAGMKIDRPENRFGRYWDKLTRVE